MVDDCPFCAIVGGEAPASIVHEGDGVRLPAGEGPTDRAELDAIAAPISAAF